MPIVAWGWPFKGNEATVENYRLVAGCGCTHTIQWVEDVDAAVSPKTASLYAHI